MKKNLTVEDLKKQVNKLEKAKKELHECKQDLKFLNDVIGKVSTMIYIVDLKTMKTIWTNYSHVKFVGYKESEVKKDPFKFFMQNTNREDKRAIQDTIEEFKDSKGKDFDFMTRQKHKNGKWLWVYSNISPYKKNPNGTPSQLVCSSYNLTGQLSGENNLEKLLTEKLRYINQLRLDSLTEREKQVVKLIANGYTNKEISKELKITNQTTETHRKNIMKKLRIKNLALLVVFAVENNLY